MLANTLDADQGAVQHSIGEEHSFARTMVYTNESHQGKTLLKNISFGLKGWIELALLSRSSGCLIFLMSYTHSGAQYYHCVFSDTSFEWKRETLDRGWVSSCGILKDNQADVLPFLGKASDTANKEAVHAFFQEPHTLNMRIEVVYELVRAF